MDNAQEQACFGFSAVSFAGLLALLQVQTLDTFLRGSLIVFSVSLPLLFLAGVYFRFFKKEFKLISLHLKTELTLVGIGIALTLSGIAFIFGHFSTLTAYIFSLFSFVLTFTLLFVLDRIGKNKMDELKKLKQTLSEDDKNNTEA